MATIIDLKTNFLDLSYDKRCLLVRERRDNRLIFKFKAKKASKPKSQMTVGSLQHMLSDLNLDPEQEKLFWESIKDAKTN